MAEVPDIIKSRVRAFLLSCTNHKEPMPTFEMNYGKLYKKLNLRELGFNNLHSFMSAIPDAVSIQREGSVIMLVGIPTEQNKHIVDMIEKQKKTTKKRPIRDSMIFPRFQTGGGRVPSLMMPSFKISYPNSGPRPYRGQPANFYKPAHPPHYSARPVPKHVTPATQSNRFYTPPNRAPKIPSPPKPPTVQKSTTRVSVHDRLGPYNSDDSSSGLEKARRRLEASREAAREKEAQQRETERKAFESAKHRRITATEPLEIRIDGDERSVYLKSSTEGKEARDERQERHKETREPRVIVLKESPNSSDSPMSFDTAVCEVDSDGTSDESYEFPVDADFLRMLVFYVISEADTDRNWVSASGLGSRMRRRLAKAGVETPPAIAESLLKFMQYEWKDMFDACSGKERGDCCHLNTPFQFCSSFRDAFSSKVEPLEPQVQPDNGTLSARIVNVEAPAFYVRLINELSEEMFLGIGEELSNEFLASESSTDVFTYRKNEMCAVSVDIDGARVWRRGRLMSFTLMGDDLDEQTSELTAFVKVFLVDSGEVVNVRAGDVRSLPRRLYSTQGLAYRCVFQGARLEDMGAFDHMLRKYLNKQVELQVHSEQTSDGLMTLQVRIVADSYLLDELVYAKAATRITCGDPDPASFPPDTNVDVLWLGWRASCRCALVKLDGPVQKQRLLDLETKLSDAVVGETGATRLIVNNVYVWRRPSELSRRVRCVNVPSDGPIQVFCLDHGCNCYVTSSTDLCLPNSSSLKTLVSGTHYFTAVLRLALLPPSNGQQDLLRKGEALQQRIQSICERWSTFTARHDTLISESPSFMLYPRENGSLHSSLNCAVLNLMLDMRFWPNGQEFRARVRPLPDINQLLEQSLPNSKCLVLRLDTSNCRPAFEAHGREYRYLQRCCLDFTAKGGDSVMCRLSDLPANTLLSQGTKLVYRQIDPCSNSSLMCRVELHEDFVGGCDISSVAVEPIDDTLLSMHMQSASPKLLFTVPVECFGERPLERFSDDLEPKELELFCELLQYLPPVDQLAISISPESLESTAEVCVDAVFTATAAVQGREFPLINLRTV